MLLRRHRQAVKPITEEKPVKKEAGEKNEPVRRRKKKTE